MTTFTSVRKFVFTSVATAICGTLAIAAPPPTKPSGHQNPSHQNPSHQNPNPNHPKPNHPNPNPSHQNPNPNHPKPNPNPNPNPNHPKPNPNHPKPSDKNPVVVYPGPGGGKGNGGPIYVPGNVLKPNLVIIPFIVIANLPAQGTTVNNITIVGGSGSSGGSGGGEGSGSGSGGEGSGTGGGEGSGTGTNGEGSGTGTGGGMGENEEGNNNKEDEKDTEPALQVTDVENSAANSGIQEGDVLLTVNGKRVKTDKELKNILAETTGKVTLGWYNVEAQKLKKASVKVEDGSIGVSVKSIRIAAEK